MKDRRSKTLSLKFYKEVLMSLLALLSVFFVFYEFIAKPDFLTVSLIGTFDIIVALLFLADFGISLSRASNKRQYMQSNWYLLFASIPIINDWAELLRGLRLFELVRLVRAGEHLSYILSTTKAKGLTKSP
jgi:disulfide bond formation protein DsbB